MRLDAGKNNAVVRVVVYDLTVKPYKSRTISVYPNGTTPTAQQIHDKIKEMLQG